jgi:hypothetical protein
MDGTFEGVAAFHFWSLNMHQAARRAYTFDRVDFLPEIDFSCVSTLLGDCTSFIYVVWPIETSNSTMFLVTPQVSAQSGPEGLSAQPVLAKISDFGHSLLLYEDDKAKDDQKYGGTLAYNAPEISRGHGLDYDSELSQMRCWALGLLY